MYFKLQANVAELRSAHFSFMEFIPSRSLINKLLLSNRSLFRCAQLQYFCAFSK